MKKSLVSKETEVQKLHDRVRDLEQQLAQARSALDALSPQSIRPEDRAYIDERLSRALFDAPYPIMVRRSDGRVVMINAAWTKITGYTLENIPTLDEWTRKAYGGQAAQHKSLIVKDGFAQVGVKRWGEFDVRTSSGDVRIWDFSSASLGFDEHGHELVMVMTVDVTERRQAEDALAESERQQKEIARLLELDRARLYTILDHLPIGVWIADEKGRLIGKNRQADQIWRGSAPLVGSIEEYPRYVSWYPESGKQLEPEEYPLVAVLQTGQAVEPVELNIRRFDGSEGTVLVSAVPLKDDQGSITGVVAINVDISSRKEAEQAVRDSEERFSKMFRKAPFAMNITRWHDGAILDMNDAWLNLLGWKREDVLGKTTAEFPFYVQPKDREQVRQRIMNDESMTGMELQLIRKDGTRIITNVATTIIEIQGERCILGVLNDITDQKQAEEALRESEHRYRELFETMQEGLVAAEVITDENFNPIDYRYLDVNPATERHFGIPREQFVGRTYTEVLPEGEPEWIEILGNVALTGQPAHVERFGRASKRWFEAHAYSPRAGQFINILTDITERKEAEQALMESEQKFSIMFDKAPFAAALSKPPNGVIINVNEEFERIFGYSRQEVVGRTGLELGINPDAETRERFLAEIQAKGSARNIETALKTKSGETRCFLLNIDLVSINEEQYILQTAQDITERKQAEERVREISEFPLQNPNPIMRFTRDGRLLFANPAAARLIDLWKQPDGILTLPNDVQEALQTAAKTQVNTQIEIDESRKAYLCLLAPVPNTDYINLYFSDITERKKAEQALRESEQRFHSLADSMPQLVWTALPDGTVDYYNRRHQEYHDIRQVNEETWEWAPVLHPDDVQATVDAWRHSVSTGEIYQMAHRVGMAGGSYRWHLSRGIPMFDEAGHVLRWFGTATDIHEQKLAQEALKDYAERLERSNRELEQFAFIASHDLQEPLRKIQVFGDLLAERSRTLEDRELEYVARMRNAAGRMREMINGLLELSRINTRSKPFTEVDLSQVTAEALSDLAEQVRRSGGNVEVAALPGVLGDPLQIRQLMQNLLNNALKYHKPQTAPMVRVFARQLKDTVQILVEDEGIGFEQEYAERIFQPFQRLVGHSEFEGSGMGLAICRKIVERHGGTITVQSKPGEGSTFTVTLPVFALRRMEREYDEHKTADPDR